MKGPCAASEDPTEDLLRCRATPPAIPQVAMDEVYIDPVEGPLTLQRSLASATGYKFVCIKKGGGPIKYYPKIRLDLNKKAQTNLGEFTSAKEAAIYLATHLKQHPQVPKREKKVLSSRAQTHTAFEAGLSHSTAIDSRARCVRDRSLATTATRTTSTPRSSTSPRCRRGSLTITPFSSSSSSTLRRA